MESPTYDVHVTTHRFAEQGVLGFATVEVIPPIPKALAEIACDNIVAHCDNLPRENPSLPDSKGTRIIPIGFCDEGATVNTLLKFTCSPTFAGGQESFENAKEKLKKVVEKVLSPSGAAILKD